MYKIVNCIECNSTVSDSATNCPKCGTSKFKGVTCLGCNRLSKATATDNESYNHGYMHKQCKDRISNEEVKIDEILPNSDLSFHCSACRQKQFINAETQQIFKRYITSYSYSYSSQTPSQVCKYCGHKNELHPTLYNIYNTSYADCCFCGYGLVPNKSVKLKSMNGEKIVFSHRFCYNSRSEKMKAITFLKTISSMLLCLAVVVSPTIAGMMFFWWGIGFIPSFLTGGAIFITGIIAGISAESASDDIQKKMWQRY